MNLASLLRAGEGSLRRRMDRVAAAVNAEEERIGVLPDTELAAMTTTLRALHADGYTLDELLPQAFATVREASRRVLGMRHFDVQVLGGIALHGGYVAEMGTGEGKTLVAALAAYLNALPGAGVHVVTVNDYLAARDAAQIGRIHAFLGLSVGVVTADSTEAERRAAYACDITYGTAKEFGFDYLRDNMAWARDQVVQRGHAYAIVDEVDSVLIDEARTPLVISGEATGTDFWPPVFARIAADLAEGRDYTVDREQRLVTLADSAYTHAEDILGVDDLFAPATAHLAAALHTAVKAKALFDKDERYLVQDGQIVIVDENTGRIMHGRRFNDGIHAALEAKEGVQVEPEDRTQATITLQHFFGLYDKLAGMTGTAQTEAAEFARTYRMHVVQIPTNRPVARIAEPDLMFATTAAKLAAAVADITAASAEGQPVLVGTPSVEASEQVSAALAAAGIAHAVLNAKNPGAEARIVAQAGRPGAVTVATNMAGRGTDILLGGNPDLLAEDALAAAGLAPGTPEWEQAWPDALAAARAQADADKARVVAAGGLYVLGTARHESRRIDDQLAGRAGRQGDPGRVRFYLSLEDDLLTTFNTSGMRRILDVLGGTTGDEPVELPLVTRAVARAQARVAELTAAERDDLVRYDEVVAVQRDSVYAQRRRLLGGEDTSVIVPGMLAAAVADAVRGARDEHGLLETARVRSALRRILPVYGLPGAADLDAACQGGLGEAVRACQVAAERALVLREDTLGPAVMRELERRCLLVGLDEAWRTHLDELARMRDGIGLRGFAQRDPLSEYRREAGDMFADMLVTARDSALGKLFTFTLGELDPAKTLTDAPAAQQATESEAGLDEAALDQAAQDQAVQDEAAQDEAAPTPAP